MSTAIVWFENDLRLGDNAALHHAADIETNSGGAYQVFTPRQLA